MQVSQDFEHRLVNHLGIEPAGLRVLRGRYPVRDDLLELRGRVAGMRGRHDLHQRVLAAGHDCLHVSSDHALEYTRWAGKRLPTEAEWEFAARGGLPGRCFPGATVQEEPSGWQTAIKAIFPITIRAPTFTGSRRWRSSPPNGYGLYDVGGNVWEWVSDWYRPDYYGQLAAAGGVARNPQGPTASFDPGEPGVKKRVHRGGSFLCTDQFCSRYMVGTRGKGEISTGTNHLGFRCVKSL